MEKVWVVVFAWVVLFPVFSMGGELNEKLGRLDAEMATFYKTMLETVPLEIDSTDYQKQIKQKIEKQDLTTAQKEKVIKERLPDYIKDFHFSANEAVLESNGIFLSEIKARLQFVDLKLEEPVVVAEAQGNLKNELETVLKHYQGEAPKVFEGAVIAIGTWSAGSLHSAAYMVPKAYFKKINLGFEDAFEVDGKKVKLSFRWEAEVKNTDIYFKAGLRHLFGSEHVVLCHEEFYKKGGPLFRSVLVHELKHYLDTLTPPKELGKELETEDDDLEKKWEREQAMYFGPGLEEYLASPDYTKYFEACLQIQKKRKPQYTPEQNQATVTKTLIREYKELVMDRFIYIEKLMENRAYREQVRYLKRTLELGLKESVALLTTPSAYIAKTAPFQILPSGERVPLINPPLPLINTNFYTTLYHEV